MELLRVDTLEEAREKLYRAVGEEWLKIREVPLEEALDKILAERIVFHKK